MMKEGGFWPRNPKEDWVSHLNETQRVLLRAAVFSALVAGTQPLSTKASTPALETHTEYQLKLDDTKERKKQLKRRFKQGGSTHGSPFIPLTSNQMMDMHFSDDVMKDWIEGQKLADTLSERLRALFHVLQHNEINQMKGTEFHGSETEFERARIALKTLRPLFSVVSDISTTEQVIVTPQKSRPDDTRTNKAGNMNVPVVIAQKLVEDPRLRSRARHFIEAIDVFLSCSSDAQYEALAHDHKTWEAEREQLERVQQILDRDRSQRTNAPPSSDPA